MHVNYQGHTYEETGFIMRNYQKRSNQATGGIETVYVSENIPTSWYVQMTLHPATQVLPRLSTMIEFNARINTICTFV
jgi:hypothetical protein